jgi:cytoskeletal protein CcmA (bactofilin family)
MSDQNGKPTGKHTLVEEGTELSGSIKSSVPIVVMGKVDGDITGPEIQVTEKGVVAGNIKVQRLSSDGEVAGSVEAEAVRIGGKVRDRTVIKARSLEVTINSNGMQLTFGECELAIGDEPDKAAAIAAATAAAESPKKAEAKHKPGAEAAPAAAAPADDEPKRKRGTVPPPAG